MFDFAVNKGLRAVSCAHHTNHRICKGWGCALLPPGQRPPKRSDSHKPSPMHVRAVTSQKGQAPATAEHQSETLETDMVVIGSGIGGLCRTKRALVSIKCLDQVRIFLYAAQVSVALRCWRDTDIGSQCASRTTCSGEPLTGLKSKGTILMLDHLFLQDCQVTPRSNWYSIQYMYALSCS